MDTGAMTQLADTPFTLTGPFRRPRQLLAEQTYDGHLSVHDGEMADKLGLAGAPIEGAASAPVPRQRDDETANDASG